MFGEDFRAAGDADEAASSPASARPAHRAVPRPRLRITTTPTGTTCASSAASQRRRASGTAALGRGNKVGKGRELRFSIAHCDVPEPYDVYWKVRNSGEEAARSTSSAARSPRTPAPHTAPSRPSTAAATTWSATSSRTAPASHPTEAARLRQVAGRSVRIPAHAEPPHIRGQVPHRGRLPG